MCGWNMPWSDSLTTVLSGIKLAPVLFGKGILRIHLGFCRSIAPELVSARELLMHTSYANGHGIVFEHAYHEICLESQMVEM